MLGELKCLGRLNMHYNTSFFNCFKLLSPAEKLWNMKQFSQAIISLPMFDCYPLVVCFLSRWYMYLMFSAFLKMCCGSFFIQHLKKVENSVKNLVVVVFLRYVTSFETGNQPVTDIFHFVVYDGENTRLENQMFTITITSTQRQPPVVTVRSGIKVRTVPTSPVK